MVTILAMAALVPALLTPPADTVNLVRRYKEGETQTYSLHVESDPGGMAIAIDAQIVFKIGKTTEDGATVTLSVRDFKLLRDGADSGTAAPEGMDSPFDKLGMPHVMSVQNESWVYILTALAGLVPGKEVEVGADFKLKWESKDKAFSADGKGKLVEVVEQDGAKVAKLDYDIEIKPSEESPGQVKCKTVVALDGVLPISCEGTVSVDGGTIKFTVKKVKS